jgi:hypothetical protein
MKTVFFKAIILFHSLILLFGFLAIVPAYAQFDPIDRACENASSSPICQEVSSSQDPLTGPDGIVLTVANIIALVSGAIAVIILIIAGLQMITSQGDSGKVKSARDAIIFTSIGLIVIVLARSIVVFIINRVG